MSIGQGEVLQGAQLRLNQVKPRSFRGGQTRWIRFCAPQKPNPG